jgi:ubiquitin-protein ligase E3 C
VVKIGFNPEYGLFTATSEGLAYPRPAVASVGNNAALLEFLGLIFGKALYEGILLDNPFAPFFTAVLQGRRPAFNDLAPMDPDLYRSLAQLRRSAPVIRYWISGNTKLRLILVKGDSF